MPNLGDLDGQFEFYAIVTPEGKIPTVDHDHKLNDPSSWSTSPIGTHAHISDFTLVFNEWEDAKADYQHFKAQLPAGTKIRAFHVVVEEFEHVYEGVEDHPVELI